jgi:pimeloyl-ACP methyl ester carboxylesterase
MHGTAALFEPLRRELSASVRVLTVEYPHDPTLDYAALTDLVRRALPAGDLFLLGESFGGPMAVRLAATASGVRGLVLASSFLRAPVPLFLGPAARALGASALARGLPAWAIERVLIGEAASPSLVASVVREVRSVPTAVLAARFEALLGVDVRDTFAAVRVPTLLIVGGRDWLVPPAATREVTRLRPDVAMLQVPGAPHLALQTHPTEAAAALKSFLAAACDQR